MVNYTLELNLINGEFYSAPVMLVEDTIAERKAFIEDHIDESCQLFVMGETEDNHETWIALDHIVSYVWKREE